MFRLAVPLVLLSVIIFAAYPALAATAPNLPLEAVQQSVSDLYSYSLKIVGLAVFVMFLIAGLSFILPESMHPSWMGEPWSIIQNAVIGLILLFSAYLILNTINPDLVGSGTQGGTASGAIQPLPIAPQRTPLPPGTTIIFPPSSGDTGHNGVYILNGILNNDDLRVLNIYVDGGAVGTLRAGGALTMSNLPPGAVTYTH